MKKIRFAFLALCASLIAASCEGGFSVSRSSASQVPLSSETSTAESVSSSVSSSDGEDTGIIATTTELPSSSISSQSSASNPVSSATSSSLVSSSRPSSSASQSSAVTSQSSYSSLQPPAADSRWNLDFSEYGETFRNRLAAQILSSGGTTTYSNCLSAGARAMAFPNEGSSTFIPFYHEAKDSEKTTTGSCNREHTWPNSRGGGMFDNDPVMVRPTLSKDNSSRGNNFYGNTASNEWDPNECGYEGARGESARIILYCATAYHAKGVKLSNNPNDSTSANSMGTLKTLLKWNREYQPTEWEKTVNNRYDQLGYRRNPFVDHPEYAEWIWDYNGLRTSAPSDVIVNPDDPGFVPTVPDGAITYDEVTDYSDLNGKSLVITNDNSGCYALTSESKSSTLPWYKVGAYVNRVENQIYGEDALEKFNFALVSGKTDEYYITNSQGKYLFGYIAGTHKSIGIETDLATIEGYQSGNTVNGSNVWKAEVSNGALQLRCSVGVYLEYFKGSFCGYGSAPQEPIRLYA